MADFEDNPFADPSGINPFADPAVTRVTDPAPSATDDDYNPFADQTPKVDPPQEPLLPPPVAEPKKEAKKEAKKEKSKKKKKPTSQWPPEGDGASPAVMQPEPDAPPSYSPGPATFSDKVSEREEEVARREAALRERETNLERLGPPDRSNNFPPFPAFCPTPFKPCFYINIKVDIPPPERWKLYALVGLLLYTWALLVINVFLAIYGAITSPGYKSEFLTTMGVSILYLILFVPGSLFCWFLPAYHAYKRDSSLAFMWWFFVMLFQGLSYLLNAIGIPNLGACGFFNGARFFTDDAKPEAQAGGAMYIIMGFLWFLGIPVTLVLVLFVHRYYRSSGQSLNRATQEAVSGAAKNEYVRGAVKSGVKAGVSAAATQ